MDYRNHKGLTFVIKISGKVVGDEAALRLTVNQLIDLKTAGCHVILVHGGGDQLDEALDGRKIKYHKIDGVRFTTDQALPVVQECLSGLNRMILAMFEEEARKRGSSLRAVGSDEINGRMLVAQQKFPFSRTGTIKSVDAGAFYALVRDERVPIIHSVCLGSDGWYNVNADEVAMPLAENLRADRLIFCSNTCMKGPRGENLQSLSDRQIDELIANGTIHSGAVVKALACKSVVVNGSVKEVVVLNGRDGSLVKELNNDRTSGTHIFVEAPAGSGWQSVMGWLGRILSRG